MYKKTKEVYDVVIRYVIILLVALPNLWLFYFIFTPLTIYPVYFLINLFYDASLVGNILLISNYAIEIIPACVAGSAYYLLLILNLSIPNIKLYKRLNMISLSFLTLLIINILRIFLLTLFFLSDSPWFFITHKLFWYLLSIVIVIGIWFTEVKLFKIKEIPLYSDIKFLFEKSILKKVVSKTKK